MVDRDYLKSAAELLSSDDPAVVTAALLDVTFNIADWQWVQDQCLRLIANSNKDIKGLAITCLGHLARIHSIIDKKKVLPALENVLKYDVALAGRAQDALDDITMFT